MFDTLPPNAQGIRSWTWDQIAPYYDDLLARPLDSGSVEAWLTDWTRISALVDELNTYFTFITTANTADAEAERDYTQYLDKIQPRYTQAEQQVKQKLLASGLCPAGFEVALRKLRTEAELYREANVPLLAEHRKQVMEYEKLAGARTVTWEGQDVALVQLFPVLLQQDRDQRERAWRAMQTRIGQDTPGLGAIWRQMLDTRQRIAANAGYPSYREYRWKQLFRFDYTPDDAKGFHAAIERVVVPAVSRLNDKRRKRLRVSSLRPWDHYVDATGKPPLHPYATMDQLETTTRDIFARVDPQFGAYFQTMRNEKLLDLESRKNKAPGGYSLTYAATRRPFIFMNAVGTHGDVQTLLHEGGHAFHSFEVAPLPYLQQRQEQLMPIEFAEVASMGMELLAAPYLTRDAGGFYSETEAARARIEHLEENIQFWPYMAMIDALQHWMYEHPNEAADIERCDDVWAELEDRFRPDWDWSGIEREKRSFWHRQGHVFSEPFYYVEYGMALLGAMQIWANALRDQRAAVAAYRRALALGNTVPLPQLYAAAGARFAFDDATLEQAVSLAERVIAELEPLAS